MIGLPKDCGTITVAIKVAEEGLKVTTRVLIGNILVVVVVHVVCVGTKVPAPTLEGKTVTGKTV